MHMAHVHKRATCAASKLLLHVNHTQEPDELLVVQNTTTPEAIIGVAGDTVRDPRLVHGTYSVHTCMLLNLPCNRRTFMHSHTSTLPQFTQRHAPLARPHLPF